MPGRVRPRLVEEVPSDEDDEEIDENEAFNSEDERKYGAFFADEKSEDDASQSAADDESAADDSDNEDDGGEYMISLLDKLDEKEKVAPAEPKLTMHHMKESINSSVAWNNRKVTLDSLVQGLDATDSFNKIQKEMKPLAKGRAVAAPAADVVADRMERKERYQEQVHDVSGWIEPIQENRKAETLDFRNKDRLGEASREVLVNNFVPTTKFEKELHQALESTHQVDGEDVADHEEDTLLSNGLSAAEVQKRRGELAKVRALMFYHEQKQHHIKKIKSKKYRRIRKKQRERFKEAEMSAELEVEREEKEEFDRMKERMTLAHKNTSKWAKRVLKRGKHVDMDTRRALSAQLQRGDDLRKRMNHAQSTGIESDDSDEDLVDSAKKVLEDSQEEALDKPQGLHKLAFMQRGVQRQRERAREEARALLLELEESRRMESEDDGEEDYFGTHANNKTSVTKSETVSEATTTTKTKKESNFVASSLTMAVSTGEVDVGSAASAHTSEHTSKLSAPDVGVGASSSTMGSGKNGNKTKRSKTHCKGTETDQDLAEPSKKPSTTAAIGTANPSDGTDLTPSAIQIVNLSQKELVARAFAFAGSNDVEEEFLKEKQEMAEREDPDWKKKNSKDAQQGDSACRGWGSWTGSGAPPPKPRRFPPKFAPPKPLRKRKRADKKKPLVILSERRMKGLADKFMLSEIPYPYKTREEYERAMSGAMGREWNVSASHKDMTRPEVQTRAGQIIQPLSIRMKRKKGPRPPAKF